MRIGGVAGEIFEVLEGFPVLDEQRTAEIPEIFAMQEAFFGVFEEAHQHRGHGVGDRQPLIEPPLLVDAHPDQENDKGFIGFGDVSTVKNFGHFFSINFKGWLVKFALIPGPSPFGRRESPPPLGGGLG